MTVEEMICQWAAVKLRLLREEVEEVAFRHNEAYCNDAGTWWPEETWAIVTLRDGAERTIYVEHSMESIPALLREIMEAAGVST